MTLDSGLEPMPDEVAIQALRRSPAPTPQSAPPSSPPTGPGWPPHIAPEQHCTSWTTCCPPTPTATVRSTLKHRVPCGIARLRTDATSRSSG